MKEDDKYRHCAKCGSDWLGTPIPEEHREHYGESTHFSRRIALYSRDEDRTVGYKCPDCGDVVGRNIE